MKVKHDQTRFHSRPPFLGTPLVPSRVLRPLTKQNLILRSRPSKKLLHRLAGEKGSNKRRPTRQCHKGERGLRTKPGFLEPCRAEKNKGSNAQAHCPSFLTAPAQSRRLIHSLPKIRRQRELQALSVPGAEQLRKLLSVGPWGYVFSKNCSKPNDNPEGKNTLEETTKACFSRG